MCAATAVSHLNDDALILRDMEQSRDNNVTAAGMVVGVALVSMLIEGVITAMCFCRRNRVVIATVVSINFYGEIYSFFPTRCGIALINSFWYVYNHCKLIYRTFHRGVSSERSASVSRIDDRVHIICAFAGYDLQYCCRTCVLLSCDSTGCVFC